MQSHCPNPIAQQYAKPSCLTVSCRPTGSDRAPRSALPRVCLPQLHNAWLYQQRERERTHDLQQHASAVVQRWIQLHGP
eukprot:5049489-Prymnesium_polylepis.1